MLLTWLGDSMLCLSVYIYLDDPVRPTMDPSLISIKQKFGKGKN